VADPQLVRERTADLHRQVEDAVGLPDSVRSRGDYVALLERFADLHVPLERRLGLPAWSAQWDGLGIVLDHHRRAGPLHDDLRRLGAAPRATGADVPPLRTFGEALGCLYVLEGSAIGGRVLAPALRATLGDVPMSFLAGDGRARARAWQSVRAALRRADDALTEDVVLGARAVFAAFGAHLPVVGASGQDAGRPGGMS
jgi:heme oxygenase